MKFSIKAGEKVQVLDLIHYLEQLYPGKRRLDYELTIDWDKDGNITFTKQD